MLVTTHWHHRTLECQVAIFSDDLSGGLKSLEKGPLVNFDAVQKLQASGSTHPLLSTLPNSEGGWLDSVRQRVEEFLTNIQTRSSVLSRANDVIRGRYQVKVRVEQLSHQLWPIERCSFNLHEMEDIDKNRRNASPREGLPLAERLETGNSTRRSVVELDQLFEDREDQRGDISKPRRILIHGRAGIGKTTLCKKAVYKHMTNELWTTHFDRILWIPLRNLTHHRDRNDLSDLLVNEFFSQSPDRDDFLEAMVKECEEHAARRTLFILDGLNEICHGLLWHGNKRAFVLELLNMPNVIVTSRPGVALLSEADPFHLRLEAIGFDLDEIHQYVEVVKPNNADAIRTWIGSNPAVQDLCRVPFQLNALCVGWNQTWAQDQETPTVTKLYGQIYAQMENQGAAESGQFLQQQALSFLEEAAFDGLVDNAAFFGFQAPESIHGAISNICFVQAADILTPGTDNASFHFLHLTFRKYLAARHIVKVLDEGSIQQVVLDELSVQLLLDLAEMLMRPLNRFFSTLNSADLSQGVIRDALRVLGNGSDLSEDAINKLYEDTINKTSRLLEPAERLMTPLSRLVSTLHIPELSGGVARVSRNRSDLLEHVANKIARLLLKPSERILKPLSSRFMSPLDSPELSEGVIMDVLRVLGTRSDLSENAITKIACLLLDEHEDVRMAAGDALRSMGNLPQSTINTILELLGHPILSVRQAAADALKSTDPSALSDRITMAISEWLQGGLFKFEDRMKALDALRGWPELPMAIFDAVKACLDDPNVADFRLAAVYALKGMSRQPNADLAYNAIACRLGDEWHVIRSAAVHALKDMGNPPEDGSPEILKCLTSKKAGVRKATIDSMKGRPHLPHSMTEGVVSCLGDSDISVRSTAVDTLKGLEVLSDSAVENIAALFVPDPMQNTNQLFRRVSEQRNRISMTMKRMAALDVLRGRPNLNEHVVRTIAIQIGDPYVDLRWLAVYALKGQPDLPIDELTEWLTHEDVNITRAGADVLRGSPDLSERVLDRAPSYHPEEGGPETNASALDWFQRLKHIPHLPRLTIDQVIAMGNSALGVREAAAKLLKGQTNLSEFAMRTIASWLGDNDQNVRWAVVDFLEGIPRLSDGVLDEIVERARANDSKIQKTALYALAAQQKLPLPAVDVIAGLIGKKDEDLTAVAIYALKGRRNLPEAVYKEFVQWLKDDNMKYTILALDGLKGGPNLQPIPGALEAITACLRYEEVPDRPKICDSVLDAIAECLHDKDAHIRWSAVYALKGRPNLPESTIAKCLDDEYVVDIRWAALKVLESNQNLGQDTISAIARCLRNEAEDLEMAALEILKRQPSLPDSAVKALLNFEGLDKQSALQLIRHDNVRRELQTIRKGPFLDALIQAARDYHLSWSADGDEYKMQTEEADFISYHR
ncbi:peptidaseCc14 [Colletotrichum musicola]|uniref:PeptidaseCc14 n=1 Tax=Colletotrichum musicola TaxID=2175873 RepID=A0A8H6NR58_9PEZI|nr:peptidaseCc14 [Colletotrichum musicola]